MPHAPHCELPLVVHVRPTVQFAIGVHALHAVFTVAVHAVSTYWPAAHVLHAVHTVSAEAEQAVLAYWPEAQVVHVAHVSAVPLTRYLPDAHAVHWESLAVEQVRDDVQPATPVQAPHTVSATDVQAALTY